MFIDEHVNTCDCINRMKVATTIIICFGRGLRFLKNASKLFHVKSKWWNSEIVLGLEMVLSVRHRLTHEAGATKHREKTSVSPKTPKTFQHQCSVNSCKSVRLTKLLSKIHQVHGSIAL